MTGDEINEMMLRLIKDPNWPLFDLRVIGDALLIELEENWDVIPEHTRAVMLGVAASLKKQFSDEFVSDIESQMLIKKLRGK